MTKLKIGITGANGFLGSYIVEHLQLHSPFEIKAFVRNIPKSGTTKEKKNIAWFVGNLQSFDDCKKFVEDIDILIHLAHINTPLNSNLDVINDSMQNLIPTLNLLESLRALKRENVHFIYSSSGGAIYGDNPALIPFTESYYCQPKTSYGIQKLMVENYLRIWTEKRIIKTSILRISNPYGTLLPHDRLQGLIGVILNQAIHTKSVNIFGDPENIRDYVHLQDVLSFIQQIIYNDHDYEIFNIGSGKGYSVNRIVQFIEQIMGEQLLKNYIELPLDKDLVKWNVLSIEKAKAHLNWEPKIDLRYGINEMYKKLITT
jgi:UDP-glucose 4-epimerase